MPGRTNVATDKAPLRRHGVATGVTPYLDAHQDVLVQDVERLTEVAVLHVNDWQPLSMISRT